MTVFAIAMVNTDGEIFHFYHPASILDPEGDCKVGQTDATRIHITEELADEGLWIRTHYWKDGAWKTREDADTLYSILSAPGEVRANRSGWRESGF